jgi:hypothetical protein
MADRADHYVWADELVWKARRLLDPASADRAWFERIPEFDARPRIELLLMAAQVHATLAAAGPGVEQAVNDQAKRAARAVGAAESQQDRQAARPPLPLVDREALRRAQVLATADLAAAQRVAERAVCLCMGPDNKHAPGVPDSCIFPNVHSPAEWVPPKPLPPGTTIPSDRPKPIETACRCGAPLGKAPEYLHERGMTGCAYDRPKPQPPVAPPGDDPGHPL